MTHVVGPTDQVVARTRELDKAGHIQDRIGERIVDRKTCLRAIEELDGVAHLQARDLKVALSAVGTDRAFRGACRSGARGIDHELDGNIGILDPLCPEGDRDRAGVARIRCRVAATPIDLGTTNRLAMLVGAQILFSIPQVKDVAIADIRLVDIAIREFDVELTIATLVEVDGLATIQEDIGDITRGRRMVRAEAYQGTETPIPRDDAMVVTCVGVAIEHFEATISRGRRRRGARIETFRNIVRTRVELGVRIVFGNVRGNPHAVNMTRDLTDETWALGKRGVVVHDHTLKRRE